MISRRMLMISGMGAATLATLPGLTRASPGNLTIVDPARVVAPPSGAMLANGPALFDALMRQRDSWQRIGAVLSDADMQMLAQMVRFTPGLRWTCTAHDGGEFTPIAGLLTRPALVAIITCG